MPKLLESTREQRRRQILDAAWRCIARQGFRDLTVDDVCADAGLSKGAFYSHFVSKDTLLMGLLADDAASIAQIAEDPATLRLSPVQRIRKVTESMLMQGADPARVQLRADVWGAMQTYPDVRAAVTAAVAERQRVFREWIDEAVRIGEMSIDFPPNALAALLLAISDGLVLHYALDPRAFRWGKISKAVDGLLDGFATQRRLEGVR
ncbi:MAG TPA: TetR/AcrR family transcriptional regulator [Candidatus Saccharimonadales bacterium]|nr:TetR/AcrR family transcriptional regulator [Candidatus Saccharimonadales bacterium]